MWDVFFSALALVFIFEGMLPFVNPGKWREMVLQLVALPDRTLRGVGLVFMLFGVILLNVLR